MNVIHLDFLSIFFELDTVMYGYKIAVGCHGKDQEWLLNIKYMT
jgi:hypothetical protein